MDLTATQPPMEVKPRLSSSWVLSRPCPQNQRRGERPQGAAAAEIELLQPGQLTYLRRERLQGAALVEIQRLQHGQLAHLRRERFLFKK